MSEVISLINLKGGVGKTVSSINIAYSFVYQQRLYKLDLKKAVKIKQESAGKTIEEAEMHKLLSDNEDEKDGEESICCE